MKFSPKKKGVINMGFHNTKYLVANILVSLCGIPEECSWIDYKAGCELTENLEKELSH